MQDTENANIWYRTKKGAGNKTAIVYDKEGNFIPIYQANDGTDLYTSKIAHTIFDFSGTDLGFRKKEIPQKSPKRETISCQKP